jgi:hypothetical protein
MYEERLFCNGRISSFEQKTRKIFGSAGNKRKFFEIRGCTPPGWTTTAYDANVYDVISLEQKMK